MRCCVGIILLIITFSAIWTPGHSVWIEDGIRINEDGGQNRYSRMVLSNDNTLIIVWWRGDQIYAQKIDMEGNPLWDPEGIAVGTMMRGGLDPGPEEPPDVTSDGQGGAVITWLNYDSSINFKFITAQRVHSTGITLWTENYFPTEYGIRISPICCIRPRIAAAPRSYPMFVIAWLDPGWSDADPGIYAQKVDQSGSKMWPEEGYSICDTMGSQSNHEICPDYLAGVFFTWQDSRSGEADIYLQRIWYYQDRKAYAPQGMPICTAAGSQTNPVIEPFDTFAVVAWNDSREGAGGFYAQKVGRSGTICWETDGIPICPASVFHDRPIFAPDNTGGYVFAWLSGDGPHAQRIDSDGNPLWGAGGVRIGPEWFFAQYPLSPPPSITADSHGNTYVCWSDSRIDTTESMPWVPVEDLYIQKLDPAGVTQWKEGGFPLSTAIDKQTDSQILCVDDEAVICSWIDWRDGWSGTDIYCQYTDCPVPDKPSGLRGRPLFNEYELLGLLLSWDEHPDDDEMSFTLHKGSDKDFIPSPENLVCITSDTIQFDSSWDYMPHVYYKLGIGPMDGCHSWYALLEYDDIYTDTDIDDTPPAQTEFNNYPNPFNPSTTITFSLPAPSHIQIEIFDTAGRRIRTIVNASYDAGLHSTEWNGKSHSNVPVSSGIYFCRLKTDSQTQVIKMLLVR